MLAVGACIERSLQVVSPSGALTGPSSQYAMHRMQVIPAARPCLLAGCSSPHSEDLPPFACGHSHQQMQCLHPAQKADITLLQAEVQAQPVTKTCKGEECFRNWKGYVYTQGFFAPMVDAIGFLAFSCTGSSSIAPRFKVMGLHAGLNRVLEVLCCTRYDLVTPNSL